MHCPEEIKTIITNKFPLIEVIEQEEMIRKNACHDYLEVLIIQVNSGDHYQLLMAADYLANNTCEESYCPIELFTRESRDQLEMPY